MKITKEDKKRLKYLIPVSILVGLLISGIVIKNTDLGNRDLADVEVTSSGKVVPMSKEVRAARQSLSNKIKTMDCWVVNPGAVEDALKFKCKKPVEKTYSRKDLLEVNESK